MEDLKQSLQILLNTICYFQVNITYLQKKRRILKILLFAGTNNCCAFFTYLSILMDNKENDEQAKEA